MQVHVKQTFELVSNHVTANTALCSMAASVKLTMSCR